MVGGRRGDQRGHRRRVDRDPRRRRLAGRPAAALLGRRPTLDQALLGTGFGYDAKRRAHQGAVLAQLITRVRDIRRFGAASLDLCSVAEGTAGRVLREGSQSVGPRGRRADRGRGRARLVAGLRGRAARARTWWWPPRRRSSARCTTLWSSWTPPAGLRLRSRRLLGDRLGAGARRQGRLADLDQRLVDLGGGGQLPELAADHDVDHGALALGVVLQLRTGPGSTPAATAPCRPRPGRTGSRPRPCTWSCSRPASAR